MAPTSHPETSTPTPGPAPAPTTSTTSTPIKSLPQIPTDRSPWTTNLSHEEIYASGERLNNFERKLVLLASHYPGHFDEEGKYKAKRQPILTGWERELVLAAKKFPVDVGELTEKFDKYFAAERNHPKHRANEKSEESQDDIIKSKPQPLQFSGSDRLGPNPGSSKAYWNTSKHPTLHMAPYRCKGYSRSYEDFRFTKKRILSNAHAYYAHRFPKAKRYDIITSSTTPTNSLASTQWRVALIVYPDPDRRDWKLLYKSNPCPTVEDAAFEVKHWVEEDMSRVLDTMNEGAI